MFIKGITQGYREKFQRARRFLDLCKKIEPYLENLSEKEQTELLIKLKTDTEENYFYCKAWLKRRQNG